MESKLIKYAYLLGARYHNCIVPYHILLTYEYDMDRCILSPDVPLD